MIPRECRRLAEVDFPIAAVSKHAVAEQSSRRGHPKGLHKWWARRPLASSRAILLSLLLPDPGDEKCPEEFRAAVRAQLVDIPQPAPWHFSLRPDESTSEGLRRVLLGFVADFAAWDNASRPAFVDAARVLVRTAHGEDPPQVLDPFAGGGSIPLEALRLGCHAMATDLNPVACLILKTTLDDIPRATADLASDVVQVGEQIRATVRQDLADVFPSDPDGRMPIAYLWARTVRCEAPRCGAEIPLLRSLWLSKKSSRWSALAPTVHRADDASPPSVQFEIFRPSEAEEVCSGTVSGARATCLSCKETLLPERVRTQLAAQSGGADVVFDERGRRCGGAMLTAVVIAEGRSRTFRTPNDRDYEAVRRAQDRYAAILGRWEKGHQHDPCPFPDESLPPIGTLGFRVQRYGMRRWREMFTARQAVGLALVSEHVGRVSRPDVQRILALRLGAMVDGSNSLVRWRSDTVGPERRSDRAAVQIVWNFCELTSAGKAAGVFLSGLDATAAVIRAVQGLDSAQIQCADATDHPLPDDSASVWFTDPPYYGSVPYADLSDSFLVWLRRALPGQGLLCDPFDPDSRLSPKSREVVQDKSRQEAGRRKDKEWFEDKMADAFAEGRRVLQDDGIGSVVFAHTTTEGWEALLSGMIRGGWTITGSWPIATELPSRLRARDSAALATRVHLVCRPRPANAPVGDWSQVLQMLPDRVSSSMEHMQDEGIRGADLVFACIGPALEVFSRYRTVESVDGATIELREYLERVWETVSQAALRRVLGESGAGGGDLEEDARLTALFLWTMQGSEARTDREPEEDPAVVASAASGPFALPFDVVRRFAQPMGISLGLWTDRIIEIEKGVVRLLSVARRAQQLLGESEAEGQLGTKEDTREQRLLDMDWPDAPSAGDSRRGAAVFGRHAGIRSADATTLDRVHSAMLLQSSGRSAALRTLLVAEVARGSEFLRLANALSALYPRGCEEKRLLDAMLLAVPR